MRVGENEKLESLKLEKLRLESFKLETFYLSWKEASEVGKDPAKLERTEWSWKEPNEIGKNRVKLEIFAENSRFYFIQSNLIDSFQVKLKFSNFNLCNFISDFPTSRFSNYMCPNLIDSFIRLSV